MARQREGMIKLKKFSASTLQRYRNLVRYQIFPNLGSVKVCDVTPNMLASLYVKLEASGAVNGGPLSPTTVRQAHNIIAAALKVAVADNMIATNPASAERLKAEDRPKPTKPNIKFLEPADLERLIVAVASSRKHRRFLIPVLLGGVLGLRRGEVLAAPWSAIDFEKATLTIAQSLEEIRIPDDEREVAADGTLGPRYRLGFKSPKNKETTQSVAIPADVLEQLRKHRIEQKKHRLAVGPAYRDEDLVVCEIDGSKWKPRSFTPAFISMTKELGFGHLYFHVLRHTAVASLIAADVHVKVIQGIARHHSAAFTMDRYGHVGDSLQAQAMARASSLVLGNTAIPDADEAAG